MFRCPNDAASGIERITIAFSESSAIIARLRSTRSIHAPSRRPKSRYGRKVAAVAMPRFTAECVSRKMSSGTAHCVNELPRLEIVCPVQNFQKSELTQIQYEDADAAGARRAPRHRDAERGEADPQARAGGTRLRALPHGRQGGRDEHRHAQSLRRDGLSERARARDALAGDLPEEEGADRHLERGR